MKTSINCAVAYLSKNRAHITNAMLRSFKVDSAGITIELNFHSEDDVATFGFKHLAESETNVEKLVLLGRFTAYCARVAWRRRTINLVLVVDPTFGQPANRLFVAAN